MEVQALLQMQEIGAAVNAMQFYSNVQPSIRYLVTQNMYIQLEIFMQLFKLLSLLSFQETALHYIFLFNLDQWLTLLVHRGRSVYVQFSSHQELTTVDQNAQGRGDEVSDLFLVLLEVALCITYIEFNTNGVPGKHMINVHPG